MTASEDGLTVYTSGVDRKICQFKMISVSKSSTVNHFNGKTITKENEWMLCGEKRYHTHDVNSLVLIKV